MNPVEVDALVHAPRVRERRLVQISTIVLCAEAASALIYAFIGLPLVSLALACGAVTMLVCQQLNRRGRQPLAAGVLLASLTAVSSALMWMSEGLHDAALLSYPALLMMAGLLASRRAFFLLLGAMLAYLALLAAATYGLHWRADGNVSDGLSLWRDSTLILLVSAMVVWIVIDDLQRAIARLQVQISKFNQSQAHVAHLARHDALTGLPNRSLGHDRIGQAIEQAGRHRSRLAMLFIDVDNLKAINDGLGHGAGDELLREIAGRLEGSVRKSDIVSRHGGDEFLIGLTDIVDLQDASTVATTILANLTLPFVIGDTEVACNCSIGIAVYPDDAADFQTLLRHADLAMVQAKESGRNAFRFYDQAMQTDLHNSLLLLSDLRQALARREFELHYQPVIALASGRVLGAEALIRWRRPDGSLFLPGQFIEAAERSGLIVDIGAWVLDEACRQLVEWQAAGCGEFTMAVNLSVVQFRRGNIDDVVRQALERSGLRPECLEVEITESTLVQDAESFILSLQRIKALGVKISIDDFGTGYSNLSYLQRFAVDKLKIDQSFTLQLLNTVQDRAIVNAIVQIARSLELVVTAEGIEDDSVLRTLVDMGCAQGQGYFFGRPQSAADFAAQHLGPAGAAPRREEASSEPAFVAAVPLGEPGLQGG